jgi:hypothetical protein
MVRRMTNDFPGTKLPDLSKLPATDREKQIAAEYSRISTEDTVPILVVGRQSFQLGGLTGLGDDQANWTCWMLAKAIKKIEDAVYDKAIEKINDMASAASGKSDSIANILNLLECYRLSKQGKTGDDAKVRDEVGSPPMRKFRGEAYAATCYGTAPVEFEFEVPATATVEEIESAANMAAMDEVQVSWSEVHPPKPRKKKVKTD